MFDIVHMQCCKWQLVVNKENTKGRHFRKVKQARSEYVFKYGNIDIEVANKYKYFGTVFNEHLNCNVTADTLVHSGVECWVQ